jgi:hypothetical protein
MRKLECSEADHAESRGANASCGETPNFFTDRPNRSYPHGYETGNLVRQRSINRNSNKAVKRSLKAMNGYFSPGGFAVLALSRPSRVRCHGHGTSFRRVHLEEKLSGARLSRRECQLHGLSGGSWKRARLSDVSALRGGSPAAWFFSYSIQHGSQHQLRLA